MSLEHEADDMRIIALNTETTGLSPLGGDRIVEIGAVEVLGRKILTGQNHVFHLHINPERDIPPEVVSIHGVDNKMVLDEPTFRDIAKNFLDFIDDATLIVYNASFDLGFIRNELFLNGFPDIEHVQVIDTLALARKMHPNQRNTLKALCDRYGIERDHQSQRSALLDSKLLAEVYLSMVSCFAGTG
ncbi:MAG: hypothetical protein AUJ58_09110 [Zetaproteobacteria bacterium CG1_02_55_237]|nr:MAG: hypothetical protein AUJ58_09110 [Zetaproteobacteria bacterium CG1_02_55_237]